MSSRLVGQPPAVPARSVPKNKFDWIYALAADPRLANSAKLIGSIVALRNLTPGGMTFRVRQTTIAKNCATTTRQVQRAFKALRDTGRIELVEERTRGRGHRGADQYRLTIPESADETSSLPDDERPDISGVNTRQQRRKYPTNSAKIADNVDDPNCENLHPKGSSTGSYTGLERGVTASPLNPPRQEDALTISARPQPFCPMHMPFGTTSNCGPCGNQRMAGKVWDEGEARRVSVPRPICDPDCRLCGGYGHLLGDDGTPIEPAVPCPCRRQAGVSA